MESQKRGQKQDAIEASILIRAIGDGHLGDTIKSRIARAASRLGWPISRVEAIWRREARRIDAWEMDALRNYRPTEEI